MRIAQKRFMEEQRPESNKVDQICGKNLDFIYMKLEEMMKRIVARAKIDPSNLS
jgi:hypothetical protein